MTDIRGENEIDNEKCVDNNSTEIL